MRDEHGRHYMQVDFDGHVARHPMPDGWGRWARDDLKSYVELVVPEMIRRLIEAKNTHRRKMARRVST